MEDANPWVEAGLAARAPRIEIRASDGDAHPQTGSGDGARDTSKGAGRNLRSGASRRLHHRALSGLRRLQLLVGSAMLLSAVAGAYLLATDGSLWILAVSHAIGLVTVVILDGVLGFMNLLGSKRIYLATLAAAMLGIVLQVGDIVTAPQYNMTMTYFASYLFGLPGFDVLLILQGLILALGLFGRGYVRSLSMHKREGKELGYSRRNFLKTMTGFGALIGLGVILGSVKLPPPPPPPSTSTQISSSTVNRILAPGQNAPIANSNNMQAGSYVTFEYPRGYPNVLFKRSDGSLAAYSLLCTHVCCECIFEATASVFYCPCHGSEFDSNGRVTRGPANYPLPSITLMVDGSGDVYPTGKVGSTPC